jgi:hypothetical protein
MSSALPSSILNSGQPRRTASGFRPSRGDKSTSSETTPLPSSSSAPVFSTNGTAVHCSANGFGFALPGFPAASVSAEGFHPGPTPQYWIVVGDPPPPPPDSESSYTVSTDHWLHAHVVAFPCSAPVGSSGSGGLQSNPVTHRWSGQVRSGQPTHSTVDPGLSESDASMLNLNRLTV